MGEDMMQGMQSSGGFRKPAIDRIPTGIGGLDGVIEGGLPVPSIILISGSLGTGRTTFCTQFLCCGASKKERGIHFMIFRGKPEWAVRFARTFEFAREGYFGSLIKHLDLGGALDEADGAGAVIALIESELSSFGPRRVVIDSPFILAEVLKDEYRRFLLNLARVIKEQSIVALIIGEPSSSMPYSADIAYISDGIIVLRNSEAGLSKVRSIEVLRMRGTSHASSRICADISSKGLAIYPGL